MQVRIGPAVLLTFGLALAFAFLGWAALAPPLGVAAAQERPAVAEDPEALARELAKSEGGTITGGGETSAEEPLFDLSTGELSVLRRLAARRRELDAREDSLVERERLLAVLEAKLAEHAGELNQIKAELAAAEARASADRDGVDAAAQERVQNLAKAYKAMKPKEAARLFDDLEMDLLIQIAREISPRALAPVIARMKPERARALSKALTES